MEEEGVDMTITKRIKRAKRLTLFKPARYKKYSEIVSFKNPTAARASVKELKKEFNKAKTREKKVRILRVAQYAANRAKAAAKKKNLSSKEKRELRQISRIYERASEYFERKLD